MPTPTDISGNPMESPSITPGTLSDKPQSVEPSNEAIIDALHRELMASNERALGYSVSLSELKIQYEALAQRVKGEG
jgi:hypothetical protein